MYKVNKTTLWNDFLYSGFVLMSGAILQGTKRTKCICIHTSFPYLCSYIIYYVPEFHWYILIDILHTTLCLCMQVLTIYQTKPIFYFDSYQLRLYLWIIVAVICPPGVHCAEKGHWPNVCNEVHEQSSMFWERCTSERAKRDRNINTTGSPFSCQFMVLLSR